MYQMGRKWTEEYMRERFPAEVREKRLEQGLDPTQKPGHRWLQNNGFRSFLRRARELGYTPDEFLLEKCGFEERSADWPCTNPETIEHVEEWLDYHEQTGERINGRTIKQARTHLRQCMEIAEERIGTSDLLKLGREELTVSVQRAKCLMEGLKEEYPNSGTRQNYVTTLRDFIAEKHDEGVIDHDPMTPLVARSGWSGERERPKHVATTDHVLAYFQACETRVEQMLILTLAGHGFRTSGVSGEETIDAYVFDAETPHVDFTKDRKNGEGRVPQVVGVDFSRNYLETLSRDPDYNGHIFPSDRSGDGARSDQWVRDKTAEIGERTDVTLSNGEKLTPKHFRQFWYTEFAKAYSEWLDRADTVASMQGSASGRVAAESYFGDSAWFDHYIKFVRPKLKSAFPDEIEPANELGNVDVFIDYEESTSGQTSIDDFGDDEEGYNPIRGPVAAAWDAYATGFNRAVDRLTAPVGDYLGVGLFDVIEETSARKAAFGFGMFAFSFALLVTTLAGLGVSIDPTTGEVVVPGHVQKALGMVVAIDYHMFREALSDSSSEN